MRVSDRPLETVGLTEIPPRATPSPSVLARGLAQGQLLVCWPVPPIWICPLLLIPALRVPLCSGSDADPACLWDCPAQPRRTAIKAILKSFEYHEALILITFCGVFAV